MVQVHLNKPVDNYFYKLNCLIMQRHRLEDAITGLKKPFVMYRKRASHH